MKHRKTLHMTKQCNEFEKETCKHGDELCLYMHKQQDFYQANMSKNKPINYEEQNQFKVKHIKNKHRRGKVIVTKQYNKCFVYLG